jgi:Nuclease-related domain
MRRLYSWDATRRNLTIVSKLMKLRRDDSCTDCKATIAAGESAYWSTTERVVRCSGCHPPVALADPTVATVPATREAVTAVLVRAAAAGEVPGGSAQREYDKRSAREAARNEQRITEDAEWRVSIKEQRPVIGWIATALTARPEIRPESQATQAWKVGAEGERRVADVLAEVPGIDVLHDRLDPRGRANIDHIAIGPAGVFVIDAKKYTGQIEVRDVGGLFRTDERLYVNKRDRTNLADGVLGQVAVLRAALGEQFADVPVQGVLCFIGGEWGWTMRTKRLNGVTVLWPNALPEHVTAPGDFGSQISLIADHLRRQLRPAT